MKANKRNWRWNIYILEVYATTKLFFFNFCYFCIYKNLRYVMTFSESELTNLCNWFTMNMLKNRYPNPANFRKFGTPPKNVNLVRLLFFLDGHCSLVWGSLRSKLKAFSVDIAFRDCVVMSASPNHLLYRRLHNFLTPIVSNNNCCTFLKAEHCL